MLVSFNLFKSSSVYWYVGIPFSSISLAATKSSEKEEVIYANLTSSGDIEKIYAVNIFEDKDIVDYGVYETVKNMNTMDKINYSNGKITIQNSEYKL